MATPSRFGQVLASQPVMPRHNRKGRSKHGPPFIQLFRCIKRSQAYHDLSPYARCALIELLDRFKGTNNGMIRLSCRELGEQLGCTKDTANKALQELDDSKLAQPASVGQWQGKKATEWCLAFYRDDRTGKPGQRNWPAFASYQIGHQSPVRMTQGMKKRPCVIPDRTQGEKTQQNGSACVIPDMTLLQSTIGGEGE